MQEKITTRGPASVWVDATTLMHWRRPAVGIVRVEQQLCLWLLSQEHPEVKFCTYAGAEGVFRPLPAAELRQQLERIAAYRHADSGQAPAPGMGRIDRLEARLKTLALAAIRRLPAAWHLRMLNLLVRLRPRLLGLLRRAAVMWRRLRHRHQPGPAAPPMAFTVDFAPGDVYVSLGLDWDYKDMAHIYRLKQRLGFRCLLFCYDVIPIRFPHLCVADVSRQFAHYFADLAWAADRVLCISDASRRDLRAVLETLQVPAPRMDVIHLGGDILPAATTDEVSAGQAAETAFPRGFILFVSTIERRKNHEVIYRAYSRLVDEGVALPDLVFVGMPGWGCQELLSDLRLDPRVQGRIHLKHHVNDAELAVLYREALFTVYPSLYEGWGLPVAESLAFGKFCLCSNTSSLPEVGEGWVEYLDPWDLPAWVERLRFYITHPDEVTERNRAIRAGYRPQPWEHTARGIFDHAMELLQEAPASRFSLPAGLPE